MKKQKTHNKNHKDKKYVGADASTVYTDSVRSKASTEIMHVCPKHQRNTQRGITLIALIITIIVLLILAVVSIRLVMNNGILGKAESAVSKYSDAEINEKIQLAYSELQMEQISNPNVDAVAFLKTSLEKQGLTGVDVVPNGDRWDIKLGEKTYTLASTGSILDWSKTLANATKHEKQSSTNTDIGIDMYGNPVNLDLWNYEINESDKTFATGKNQGSKRSVGYIGEITSDGKIIGEIPQYLKIDSNVYTLTSIGSAFADRTELTVAPVIPNTVKDMNYAFINSGLIQAPKIPESVLELWYSFGDCTSLTQTPEIPNSVTDMNDTFYNCTSLTQAPVIPNSVTDMNGTFYNCTSLTQAPVIPSSVTRMGGAFSGCTSLTQAPVIPNSVTNMFCTFAYCKSLTQAPEIPNSVTEMGDTFRGCTSLTGTLTINASNVSYYKDCFNNAATNVGTNLVVTGSCPQLDAIIATKSANSHITKGN